MANMTARIVLAATMLATSGAALAQRDYDDRGGDRDDRRGYGGGGRPSATFFVKDKFGGRGVTIDRPVRSMREFDLNDKISSVDIRGGSWLVCSDDDFQGRCVTLDRSVRHLSDMGMDDKISSARPIWGGGRY